MKKLYDEIKKIIEKITEKSRISKKMLLSAFLLLAGIIALTVSEISAESKAASAQTTVISTSGTGEYAADLEMRLTSIISSISGAGKTKVMVTLESGSEEIYLHDYNYGENADPSGKNSFERKDEYVIVDSDGGEKGIEDRKNRNVHFRQSNARRPENLKRQAHRRLPFSGVWSKIKEKTGGVDGWTRRKRLLPLLSPWRLRRAW